MRILFLGNFEAEFSSENYYLKTFRKLGHEVICFQEGKTDGVNIHITKDVDMFFWVHTHGWKTPNIGITLDCCRKLNTPSVAYHLDLYMGIPREKMLFNDPYFQVDHFFTVDKLMADWLNANTRCQGHFLPAGVFEDECFLGTANKEKYPHDIVFTGSTNYHPEWPYRGQLIRWLKETYGSRFGHYGPGGLPTVRGPELNNLYASAKVVVGDTLCKGFDYPWYTSDRLFEVCGRGGCLIYPTIKGISYFYDFGTEIHTYQFENFGDLRRIIEYCLDYPQVVTDTRVAALNRTISEHTYTHRMQKIIDTVKQSA